MEGHLGGTGVDGRQLTSGKGGAKNLYPKAALHLHHKVPSSMHWRVGHAGDPTLLVRTASGPQSHALRGKDDHFPERSHYHRCMELKQQRLVHCIGTSTV